MTTSNITRGQLERNVSQRLQAFYLEKVGRRPEKIICQFFDEKLAIFIEKVMIPSERLLLEGKHPEAAFDLRNKIDVYIKPLLQELLGEILETGVITILVDTDLKKDVSGMIAVLDSVPPIRDPESIPKIKKEKTLGLNNE